MRRSTLLFGMDNRPTPGFTAFLREVRIPGNDLASIDDALQARFFQRGPDQQPLERWNLEEVEVHCPRAALLQHLGNCGFIHKTQPRLERYRYAGLPGALVTAVARRLCDLVDAWEQGTRWEDVIVFGGGRPLIPEKETPAILYNAFPRRFRISDVAFRQGFDFFLSNGSDTEIKMMEWLWYCAKMPHDLMVLVEFVDVPMKPPLTEGGPLTRPSTEDTAEAWIQTRPKPGPLLLSSGAPYGMAQEEAFARVLDPYGINVEAFGHEAPTLSIPVLMREVAGAVHSIRKTRNV